MIAGQQSSLNRANTRLSTTEPKLGTVRSGKSRNRTLLATSGRRRCRRSSLRQFRCRAVADTARRPQKSTRPLIRPTRRSPSNAIARPPPAPLPNNDALSAAPARGRATRTFRGTLSARCAAKAPHLSASVSNRAGSRPIPKNFPRPCSAESIKTNRAYCLASAENWHCGKGDGRAVGTHVTVRDVGTRSEKKAAAIPGVRQRRSLEGECASQVQLVAELLLQGDKLLEKFRAHGGVFGPGGEVG